MSKKYRDRQTEKITRTYEHKGHTDGEDNAYVRTYTRAQAEVAYIEGSVPISVSVFVSVSGSVSGSVSVVRGIAPYI